MMRVTNGMMMTNTKNNINKNKATVDEKNTQMSTQKKITKPSDDPLIAIKSLRLSTTLSQIHQFYDNNITDAESWMDVSETAMANMKTIVTDAYKLTVNGATDTLTEEDRNTIYTQLNSLSKQMYAEANADYAGRTVFSGFKTDSTVAFTNATEAAKANYQISEKFSYSDIEKKDYYANQIDTPSSDKVQTAAAGIGTNAPGAFVDADGNKIYDPAVQALHRVRLGYDDLADFGGMRYSFEVSTSSTSSDQSTHGVASINTYIQKDYPAVGDKVINQAFTWKTEVKDGSFVYDTDPKGDMNTATLTDVDGYSITLSKDGTISFDTTKMTCVHRTNSDLYKDADGNVIFEVKKNIEGSNDIMTIKDSLGNSFVATGALKAKNVTQIVDNQKNTIDTVGKTIKDVTGSDVLEFTPDPGTETVDGHTTEINNISIHTDDKNLDINMKMVTMTEKEFAAHLSKLALGEDNVANGGYTKDELDELAETMIYLPDSGEMIVGDKLSDNLVAERAILELTYDKNGFDVGEVRPEMYYNCIKKSDVSAANWITYNNYDADDNWIPQGIDYAISGNQYLQVNTQINDIVNSDFYRDMQEMIDTVKQTIDAHTTIKEINQMMKQSQFSDAASQAYLKDALEAAQKQADYFDDNLHNVFSKQITHFENYLEKVNLAITDIGSRGDQLSLASNRMSNQQTTFRELKSNNEDAELSDITIDYTSAYTAYQASLQAAGKIDKMSLLDYI